MNGSLDKVELLRDGGVNVVDYKTGRPKSRAEIEGKTKGSDGNYKRQLVFYRLLLDGARNPARTTKSSGWRMKTGTIDFIKPDARGRFHRQVFDISDAEVADLKNLVADVAHRIFSFSFWNATCDDSSCDWCRLSQVLQATKNGRPRRTTVV